MHSSLRRLLALQKHVTSRCCSMSTAPRLLVTPSSSLMDEKVQIRIHGLLPSQVVTLVVGVGETNAKFESRAVYRANTDGLVNLDTDESLSGTYTGKDPMGLFWSLEPCAGQGRDIRLKNQDISTPFVYTIKLYNSAKTEGGYADCGSPCMAEVAIEKYHMSRGVKRIPVTEGKFRGAIFVPEGEGPFPALIDTFGGAVALQENRAALLASRGYATFAITYLYLDHLPKSFVDGDPLYVTQAADWFRQQPYVDPRRFGAIGSSTGGFMSLIVASIRPYVRAVVNVNGLCTLTTNLESEDMSEWEKQGGGQVWRKNEIAFDRVYRSSEGLLILANLFDRPNPQPIPAWRHGAKLLFLCGEDDTIIHKKWHSFYKDRVPAEYCGNAEFHSYPGAGHQIEPPYTPNTPMFKLGKGSTEMSNVLPEVRIGELPLKMRAHYSSQDCRDNPHAFKLCSRAICVSINDRCSCEYDVAYQCSDGQCIPLSHYCNGRPDCSQGEDEHSCTGSSSSKSGELSTSIIMAIVAACVFVCAIVVTMVSVYIYRRWRNNTIQHSKSAMEPLQGERPSTSEDNDSSERITKKCLNSQYDKYHEHVKTDKHRTYYSNAANMGKNDENEDYENRYTDKYYNQTKVKTYDNYSKEQIKNNKNKWKGKHKEKIGGYVFVSRNQTTPAKLMLSYEDSSDQPDGDRTSIHSSCTNSSSSLSQSPPGSLRFLDRDEFSNMFASGLLCASTPRPPVKFSVKNVDETGNISTITPTIIV